MNATEIEKELLAKGYPVDQRGLAKIIMGYVLRERERCAKVAEEFRTDNDATMSYRTALVQNIATAIRESKL